jgi:hypothetical protein
MKVSTLIRHAQEGFQQVVSKTNLQKNIESEIAQAISEENLNPAQVANIVRKKGYILFKDVLSRTLMDKMSQEFRSIIDYKRNDFSGLDLHDGSVCVRVKPLLNIQNLFQLPTILSFYNTDSFRAITNEFYGDSEGRIEYMSEVFVHETPETKEPLSGKLHWDRAQTLKFWVYVDDVPEEAGPMLIEPDSTNRNRDLRKQLVEQSKVGLKGGKDNLVMDPFEELIALSAGKGSILIHDTDASHGASEVRPGFTRMIVRGHCRQV